MSKASFLLKKVFWKNEVERCSKYKNTKNGHFSNQSDFAVCIPPQRRALRCASYCGVKLLGVHHTAKSKCTLRSQNQNLYESLGAFKGTIRRIPFRGEQFYHVRKDLKKNFLFAKTKILTRWCNAHCGVEFFKLCDRISQRNQNQVRNRNLWESLVAFKGTTRRIPFRGEQFFHVRKDLKKIFLIC